MGVGRDKMEHFFENFRDGNTVYGKQFRSPGDAGIFAVIAEQVSFSI